MKSITIQLTGKQVKQLAPIYRICNEIENDVKFKDRPYTMAGITLYESGKARLDVYLMKNEQGKKVAKMFNKKYLIDLDKEK